jgi:hypothetical protein
MNELEIIRSQLAIEQAHAAEVVDACAAVFGRTDPVPSASDASPFREASVSYLVWVLARFEERDQTLTELLASRQAAGGSAAAGAQQLVSLVGRSGTSREALSRLEAALRAGESPAARAGWQEFGRFFNSAWAPRRAALEAALVEHLPVADWRAVCAIDADSILDERNRFGRVAAQLPPGTELRRRPPADAGP